MQLTYKVLSAGLMFMYQLTDQFRKNVCAIHCYSQLNHKYDIRKKNMKTPEEMQYMQIVEQKSGLIWYLSNFSRGLDNTDHRECNDLCDRSLTLSISWSFM